MGPTKMDLGKYGTKHMDMGKHGTNRLDIHKCGTNEIGRVKSWDQTTRLRTNMGPTNWTWQHMAPNKLDMEKYGTNNLDVGNI